MGMKVSAEGKTSNSNAYSNNEVNGYEQIIKEIEVTDKVQNEDIKIEEKDIKEKEINEKDIKKAVKKLNSFIQDEGTHAEYSIHEGLHRLMIKIVDNETDKVILEVPPKKIVDMVAKMCELAGVLFDKKA
jgi:flagellar protein FlaG